MTEAALAKKLSEVMGLVGWIEKKGHNAHQNYDFVREVDIVDAVSKHLAERHVAIIPKVVNLHFEPMTTKAGVGGFFAVVTMSYTFVDGDTGESLTAEAVGAGTDQPGDKAFYKAQTGAKKYALTQAFLIATGEDPEDEQAPKKGNASKAQPAFGQAPKPAAQPVQQRPPAAATPGSRDELVARLKKVLADDHPKKPLLSSMSDRQLEALAKSHNVTLEVPESPSPEGEGPGIERVDAGSSPEGHFGYWAELAHKCEMFPEQLLELIKSTPEGQGVTDLRWLDPSSDQAKKIIATVGKGAAA